MQVAEQTVWGSRSRRTGFGLLNSALSPTEGLERPPCKEIPGLTSALQVNGEAPNRCTTTA